MKCGAKDSMSEYSTECSEKIKTKTRLQMTLEQYCVCSEYSGIERFMDMTQNENPMQYLLLLLKRLIKD